MWRLERGEWLSWQYLDTWRDRVEMSTNIFFYSQKVGHGMAMACPSCGQCPVSPPPLLFVFWIAARRRQEIHLMNHYSDPLNIHLTYSLCKTAWPSHRITELGSLHLHIYLYFSLVHVVCSSVFQGMQSITSFGVYSMSRTACFTRRIINQLLLLSTFKEFYNTGMLKYSLTISYLGAGQLGL